MFTRAYFQPSRKTSLSADGRIANVVRNVGKKPFHCHPYNMPEFAGICLLFQNNSALSSLDNVLALWT